MSPRKSLSVLIPTFNRAEFLFFALQGLTKQTFKDFKVIIYDDGSEDNTLDIVNSLKSKLDITYIKGEKNHGAGYARKELLKLVGTPYFAWQDSDDISEPDRFEKQISVMQADNCACFSHIYFFRHPNKNRRHLYEIDVTKYTSRSGLANNMSFPTGMFSADVAKIAFNSRLRYKEDLDWMLKLIKSKVNFVCVPEPLYYLRLHDGRTTKNENRDTK